MSANNWTFCPKCQLVGLDRRQVAIDKARDSYGKVSPEEYEALLFKSRMPIDEEETLREDYELGISNVDDHTKQFYISYHASCDKCGFSYRFTRENKLAL